MPTWSPVLVIRLVASSVLGQQRTEGRGCSRTAWEAHTFPFPAPFPSSLHIKSEVHSDCSLPFWPHTKRGGEGLQRLAAK